MISDFGTFPDSKLGLDRKDSIGKLSSIVLVLGLCFELFAAARTNQLSDEVIVDLELQASRTITALGPAMERASKANATAIAVRVQPCCRITSHSFRFCTRILTPPSPTPSSQSPELQQPPLPSDTTAVYAGL
jgi:hypothetical protein